MNDENGDPVGKAAAEPGTRAVIALLGIIADANTSTGKRIEAADALLSYEAAAEAVEVARTFLTNVFEDGEADVELRLAALKLMRKAEAKRVALGTTHARDEAALRARARDLAMAKRRVALCKAGLWPAPAGWADDILAADFEPAAPVNVEGLAEQLKRARLTDAQGA